MSYQQKYLKYKTKYLQLKTLHSYNNQIGGNKPVIINYNNINLFIPGSEMEQFLNPIYGLYMCESGFIINSYWLFRNDLTDDTNIQIINRLCTGIPGTGIVKPTKDILKYYTPIDIGRYIALLYICKVDQLFFIKQTKKDFIYLFMKRGISEDDLKLLNDYIRKVSIIKNQIKLKTTNKIEFHIILYCLWWVLNNDNGINDYYKGIRQVFNIYNSSITNPQITCKFEPQILLNISFEEVLIKTTSINFTIYDQSYSKHFCESKIPPTYADCGEITAHNLINLICYNSREFDISILEKFGAIDQLIEYYTTFSDFTKLSSSIPQTFDGLPLDSRDAWSRLIILYAHNNIKFRQNCNNSNPYKYEIDIGMALDNSCTNFIQLIKNLLPGVTNWDDFTTQTFQITDETGKGEGKGEGEIIINKGDNKYIIHCNKNHYYMRLVQKPDFTYDITNYSPSQLQMINILLHKEVMTIDNFIWFLLSPELLVRKINDTGNKDNKLQQVLFILSLTERYVEDTRRQMYIDIKSLNIIDIYNECTKLKNKEAIFSQYYYKYDDLEFLNDVKLLRLNTANNISMSDILNKITDFNFQPLNKENQPNLTSIGDNFLSIKYKGLRLIDLTNLQLSRIISIGDSFCFGCENLINIVLNDFTGVISIGNSFMRNCWKLGSKQEVINLSAFGNLKYIGDEFMIYCNSLQKLDLSKLSQLTSVGNYFMSHCISLLQLDLSTLSQLTSIGYSFMSNCEQLQELKLPILSQLTSIGHEFMNNCTSLTNIINLNELSQLTSISKNFMNNCNILPELDLSKLAQLVSIGSYFMNNCSNLIELKLPILSQLTSIDKVFMYRCKALPELDLSNSSQLKSISNNFMNNCTSLRKLKLPILSQLTSIDNNFISNCTSLPKLDLSGLSQLTSIGDSFMKNCTSLRKLKLPILSQLTSINSYFLYNCYILPKLDLSGLSQVKSISHNVMNNCTSLVELILPKLSQLTSIGNHFMYNCQILPQLDLSELSQLTSIGNQFMSDCRELNTLTLPISSQLTSIGDDFIFNCDNLPQLDLSSSSQLTSIGNKFMYNCSKLQILTLPISSQLTSIGDNFMYRCIELKQLDLSKLLQLTSIGNYFMNNCTSLPKLDLSNSSQLKSIGNNFMNNCTSLRKLNLSGLSQLKSIGNSFLLNCINLEFIDLSNLNLELNLVTQIFINIKSNNTINIKCPDYMKEVIDSYNIQVLYINF